MSALSSVPAKAEAFIPCGLLGIDGHQRHRAYSSAICHLSELTDGMRDHQSTYPAALERSMGSQVAQLNCGEVIALAAKKVLPTLDILVAFETDPQRVNAGHRAIR